MENHDADHLFEKLRANTLTRGELEELRAIVGSMSDRDIEAAYAARADEPTEIAPESVDRIRHQVDACVSASLRRRGMRRYIAIAAGIMLPLVAAVAWLSIRLGEYSRYDDTLTATNEVVTGVGESVTVRLPDGSQASIGPESALAYSLKDFNGKERTVDGAGNLELAVVKNPTCPFTLMAPGLRVRVLGTKFTLVARDGAPDAKLYLKEGSVEMESLASGERLTVRPNELVVMDYATGRMSVERMDNANDARAMLRGDMVFDGEPLSAVAERMSKVYGFSISWSGINPDEKIFTGYIPIGDRSEALSIVEHAFNLKADSTGRRIRFSPQ